MKKSQKLFTGLILAGLISMMGVNLLLRAEYVKGNITSNGPEEAKIKRYSFKPFHHIVFEGAVRYAAANGDTVTIRSPRRIFVHTRKDTSAYMDLGEQGVKFIKTRQSGDTLYISHLLIEQRNNNVYDDWINMIYTPDSIASITSICGTVNVKLQQESPLRIKATDYSVVELDGVKLGSLDLHLDDHTEGYVRSGGYISDFSYRMTNGSFMEMESSTKLPLQSAKDSVLLRDTTISVVPAENEAIIYRLKRKHNIPNF